VIPDTISESILLDQFPAALLSACSVKQAFPHMFASCNTSQLSAVAN